MRSPNPPEVDELLQSAAGGNPQALDDLLSRFRRRLRGLIAARLDSRLQQRVDASDIVQETLVIAADRLPDYRRRRPVPFFLWLRRLALERMIHSCRQHLNAQKRTARRDVPLDGMVSDDSCVRLAEQLQAGGNSPSESLMQREARERVRLVLGRLSPIERQLIVMKYAEQLTNAEIATALGTTVAAVKMRHLRALRRLKGELNPREK